MKYIKTKVLLDILDDHACTLDKQGWCECLELIAELSRRMNKDSEIL